MLRTDCLPGQAEAAHRINFNAGGQRPRQRAEQLRAPKAAYGTQSSGGAFARQIARASGRDWMPFT